MLSLKIVPPRREAFDDRTVMPLDVAVTLVTVPVPENDWVTETEGLLDNVTVKTLDAITVGFDDNVTVNTDEGMTVVFDERVTVPEETFTVLLVKVTCTAEDGVTRLVTAVDSATVKALDGITVGFDDKVTVKTLDGRTVGLLDKVTVGLDESVTVPDEI